MARLTYERKPYPQTAELELMLEQGEVNLNALFFSLPSYNSRPSEYITHGLNYTRDANQYFTRKGYSQLNLHYTYNENKEFIVDIELALAIIYLGPQFEKNFVAFLDLLNKCEGINFDTKHFDEYKGINRSRNEVNFISRLVYHTQVKDYYPAFYESQVRIGRYRVDLLVKEYEPFGCHEDTYGEDDIFFDNQFIVEFDESYHDSPSQLALDYARDKDIFENHNLKVVRVRAEDQDKWFECFDLHQPFIDIKRYELSLIAYLNRLHDGKLTATLIEQGLMSKDLWLEPYWGYDFPKQPLKFIRGLLDKYSLTYKQSRINCGRTRAIILSERVEQEILDIIPYIDREVYR